MPSDQELSNLNKNLSERLDVDFALEAAGLGIWEYDPATGQANWDDRCRALYGLNKGSEISYEQAFRYIHPDDAELVKDSVESVLAAPSGSQYDVIFRTIGGDDKKLRWVRFQGRADFTETGEVWRFGGVAREVTQEVLAQQQLEKQSQQLSGKIDELANSEERYRSLAASLEEQVQQRMESLEAANEELLAATEEQALVNKALEDNEFALSNTIELAELGTFSVNVATNLLTCSPRVADWFGFESLTADAEAFINGVGESDQDYVRTSLYNTLMPGSDGRYDVVHSVINTKTGHKRILHALGRVYFDADGNPFKIEGTAQDTTAQQELQALLEQEVQQRTEELTLINEELEEANSLLTRSNENLQQFAYVASHDLQEPLRKIQQFGDLLRNQYDASLGDGIDFLDRMQSAASRMSTLIKDLLAYSRIANQRDTNESVALSDVVNRVLSTLDLTIEQTGAHVIIGPLPTITGDAIQLNQLFQNLISNALKFRRQGAEPVITVNAHLLVALELPPSIRPGKSAPSYYRIDVTDNGIGFEEKYLDRIFEVFQRLHGRNEFAGTGIGLAICEKVVANHGGVITASSQPGEGATFSVYLPA